MAREGEMVMVEKDAVLRVDPSTLLVGPNVRRDVQLSKEFVASIKQHGVLVPIVAHEVDGSLEVVDGQRRTLAAVDAGVNPVPVVVVQMIVDEGVRIVEQLVVNDQRDSISIADTVAAVKQLELFGMPASTIAKKVGMPKADVVRVSKVGASEAALAALRGQKIDFEAAEVLAEFEGDVEAQAELSEHAAKGYHLAHMAQGWRDRRLLESANAEAVAEGLVVIEAPGYNSTDPLSIRYLHLDKECKGETLDTVPPEKMLELAGDGLRVRVYLGGYGDERGLRREFYVAGWRDRGLFAPSWALGGKTTPSTPEEVEKLKAERRVGRETTKAWASASAVRFSWIRDLLQRKVMPKGWELAAARHIVEIHSTGYAPGQWRTIAALLQLEPTSDTYSLRGKVSEFLEGNPTKAAHVALACALGSVEGATDFDRKGWQFSPDKARAHLVLLASWGYELSEVEQDVVKPARSRKAA